MTDYEYALKRKYENDNCKFLYDTIGYGYKDVIRRAVNVWSPSIKLFCVQGECVNYDYKARKGTSRWLVFQTN